VSDLLQIVALGVSGLLLLLVLELVRRGKLTEEYSFIWILGALGLLVFSSSRQILHVIAAWLGIAYPPALLLLAVIFFFVVASLYFSVVVSRQRQQIEQLAEEVAILAAQQRELQGEGVPPAPTTSVATGEHGARGDR
jgi:hypothetical protein